MICLITLDRFIVLKFPFSTVRFKGRSALASAALAWMVGISLAAVPLVPSLSWSFYGHTGICIPLPVTRGHFEGKDYAFAVMIVFNFILFLCISLGQVRSRLKRKFLCTDTNECKSGKSSKRNTCLPILKCEGDIKLFTFCKY